MNKQKTGVLIREARIAKNYTQSELGDLIGVSNKAVSRWENGESFPDIGVLENLSNVLDIELQDIITGDVKASEDEALTAVVREARIQRREYKRIIFRYSMIFLLIVCYLAIGYSALGKNGFTFNKGTTIYEIFFVISSVMMAFVFSGRTNEFKKRNRGDMIIKTISIVSLLWGVLLPWSTMLMVVQGNVPFGMKLSSIGLFINWQLIALFFINIITLSYAFYRYETKEETLHWESYVSVAVIHIIALYGAFLHRLDTLDTAIKGLASITVFVIVLFVATIIGSYLARRMKNTIE